MRASDSAVPPGGGTGREGDAGRPADPFRSAATDTGQIGGRALLVAAGIIVAAAVILLAMGRVPVCTCGTIKLWHGTVQSAENSQHLSDWYTPSHVIHGVLLYGGLWLLSRIARRPISVGTRLVLATLLEAGWEVVENTDFVIDRYRETTIALDYYGDSIVNSVADMVAMVLGFVLAWRLPVAASVALVLVLEIGVAAMIRDNLALNVLMLLYPLDAIKAWQAGASG